MLLKITFLPINVNFRNSLCVVILHEIVFCLKQFLLEVFAIKSDFADSLSAKGPRDKFAPNAGIWTQLYWIYIHHLENTILLFARFWQFGIQLCRVLWIDFSEKGKLQLKVTMEKRNNVKKRNQRQQKLRKTWAYEEKRKQEGRTFRQEWKKTFVWLQFDKTKQEMFCTACLEFSSQADKNSWFFTGSQAFHIQNIK